VLASSAVVRTGTTYRYVVRYVSVALSVSACILCTGKPARLSNSHIDQIIATGDVLTVNRSLGIDVVQTTQMERYGDVL